MATLVITRGSVAVVLFLFNGLLSRKTTRLTESSNPRVCLQVVLSIPIGSMYAIYGNIYHQYTPNVSIYTIHGSYGIVPIPIPGLIYTSASVNHHAIFFDIPLWFVALVYCIWFLEWENRL